MPIRSIAAAFVLALASAAALPAAAHPGHDEAAAAQTVQAQGVVRAIDARAGTITIQHGAIAALNWPAMTMTFRVASGDLLRGVTVGTRIHFVLRTERGAQVVTQIHRL